MHVYLDWAATSIPDREVIDSVRDLSMEVYANPSSSHSQGLKASKVLEESRARCATALGVDAEKIYFTSGGTESNNIALLSVLNKKSQGSIVSTNIEHPSVYEPLEFLRQKGFRIIRVDPDPDGFIDPDKIVKKLDSDTVMVSVMHVNNETGAIQPAGQVCEAVRDYSRRNGKKIPVHCDGVQAAGKIISDLRSIPADFYTASSHKISGPRGAGLLYSREKIVPVFRGGGQEKGIRSGTENLPAIYGFSLSLEKYINAFNRNLGRAEKLCNLLLDCITGIRGCRIVPGSRSGSGNRASGLFSPYIVSFCAGNIPAEVLTRVMSDRGFFISAGSACSTHKKEVSRTLKSMKIDGRTAASTVRISTGVSTLEDHITGFCEALEEESKKLFNVYGMD